MRYLTGSLTVALLATVSTTAVAAQEANPQDAAEAPAEGNAIVVTAQRREQSLQDVSAAITAVGTERLADAQVNNLQDLQTIVPSVNFGSDFNQAKIFIRGVGANTSTTGNSTAVALHVDGAVVARAEAQLTSLFDLERVEVLRGPQGTVFGRNATGGLINVITPDPKFTPGGRLAVKYGFMRNDAQDLDVRGYVTGPLSENVAGDIAVLYKNLGGYIKDLLRPGGGLGDMEIKDIRAKLLFKPSDRFQIVFTGEVFDQKSHVGAYQPYENNTIARNDPGVILPTGPWQASVKTEAPGDSRPYLDLRRYNLAMHTRLEFNAFNLETTTGYLDYDWHQRNDSDSSNIFYGDFPATLFSESISQEVRLLSTSSGRLQWLLGGYFYYLDGGSSLRVLTRASANQFDPELTVKSWAGFAEGTLELVDSLFVTAGVRYTTEDRTFKQTVNGRLVTAPAPGWPADGKAEASFNKWTYRGAVRWQFANDANVYVSYGTGFKSGVFNMAGASPFPVNPETITAIEGGIKADPLPWLRTNLSIYHNDYKDLQVQAKDAGGVTFLLQNAANAKIYGGEFELTASPNRDLNLRGSIAYIHGRYEDFPLAQAFIPRTDANGVLIGGNNVVSADASGKKLTRAPKFTFNLGFDWTTDMAGGRLGFAGNLFHSSKLYYDFLNIFEQKAYTLTNAQVSWTTPNERWRFNLWVTNLTNEKVWQTLRPGALSTDGFYEQPRKIGVGAEVRF